MFDIVDSIRTMAAKNRYAPAFITPNVYMTHGDLIDRIACLSNYLADRKVPRRSKVYLNTTDPALRLVAMMACLHYGLIPFVVLDISNVGDDVDYDFVIGSAMPQDPTMKNDLIIDQSVFEGKLADTTLREFPDIGPDELLFVGTTTGTTGRKKMLAQMYGRWLTRNQDQRNYAADDRVMYTIGDVTQYGFVIACHTLRAGGAVVRRGQTVADNLKTMAKYSVNKLITTPSALDRMMDVMDKMAIRLPSLKWISLTGSLFSEALVRRTEKYFDAELHVGYGSSEVGRISAGTIKSSTFRTGYVGELWPNVRIMSSGTPDNPAPFTIVNDQTRFTNYYSKGKIIKDERKLYTLPDLGYLDGYSLYLVGRDDEVFNVSGNKVPFSRIEAAVRTIPKVADAAVVGGTAAGDPLALIVAVVGDVDPDVVVKTVVGAVKLAIVAPHVRVVQVPEIARNEMGKTDRGAIVEAYLATVPAARSMAVGAG